MIGPTAAETVQLYAAGSLRGALTEIAKVYESSTGNKVEAKYGPSGLLKTEFSAEPQIAPASIVADGANRICTHRGIQTLCPVSWNQPAI